MLGHSFHGDSSARVFGIAVQELPQSSLGDQELLSNADASNFSALQRCVDRVSAKS
jgi:hypothetical protein